MFNMKNKSTSVWEKNVFLTYISNSVVGIIDKV